MKIKKNCIYVFFFFFLVGLSFLHTMSRCIYLFFFILCISWDYIGGVFFFLWRRELSRHAVSANRLLLVRDERIKHEEKR